MRRIKRLHGTEVEEEISRWDFIPVSWCHGLEGHDDKRPPPRDNNIFEPPFIHGKSLKALVPRLLGHAFGKSPHAARPWADIRFLSKLRPVFDTKFMAVVVGIIALSLCRLGVGGC